MTPSLFSNTFSVSDIIKGLKEDGIEPRVLLDKLEHIKGILTSELEERKAQRQNNVPIITVNTPELGEEIGADVAEWLASTFTKPQSQEVKISHSVLKLTIVFREDRSRRFLP